MHSDSDAPCAGRPASQAAPDWWLVRADAASADEAMDALRRRRGGPPATAEQVLVLSEAGAEHLHLVGAGRLACSLGRHGDAGPEVFTALHERAAADRAARRERYLSADHGAGPPPYDVPTPRGDSRVWRALAGERHPSACAARVDPPATVDSPPG